MLKGRLPQSHPPHTTTSLFGIMNMNFNTLLYKKEGRLAFITLNRPERLNAINNEMPLEIQRAVEEANLVYTYHRHTDKTIKNNQLFFADLVNT